MFLTLCCCGPAQLDNKFLFIRRWPFSWRKSLFYTSVLAACVKGHHHGNITPSLLLHQSIIMLYLYSVSHFSCYLIYWKVNNVAASITDCCYVFRSQTLRFVSHCFVVAGSFVFAAPIPSKFHRADVWWWQTCSWSSECFLPLVTLLYVPDNLFHAEFIEGAGGDECASSWVWRPQAGIQRQRLSYILLLWVSRLLVCLTSGSAITSNGSEHQSATSKFPSSLRKPQQTWLGLKTYKGDLHCSQPPSACCGWRPLFSFSEGTHFSNVFPLKRSSQRGLGCLFTWEMAAVGLWLVLSPLRSLIRHLNLF